METDNDALIFKLFSDPLKGIRIKVSFPHNGRKHGVGTHDEVENNADGAIVKEG